MAENSNAARLPTANTTNKSGFGVRRSIRFGRENSVHDLKLMGTSVVRSVNANAKHIQQHTNKTFQAVRTTLDNISQKLRRSTRRRYRLEAMTTPKRANEENRPVKLYSPFGIETPSKMKCARDTRRLSQIQRTSFRSPSQRLKEDVVSLENSNQHLNSLAQGISLRASMRK